MSDKPKRKSILKRLFARTPLLSQIEIVFILGMLLAMYINNFISHKQYKNLVMGNLEETYVGVATSVKTRVESVYNIDWLINYWTKNYEIMDLDYNDPDAKDRKIEEFLRHNPTVDIYNLSEKQLEKLSDRSKKLYAEAEYLELLSFFDEIKQTYKSAYITCFNYTDDGEAFYYMSGANPGEKRGNGPKDIYSLGVKKTMDISLYPVLSETIKTGTVMYNRDMPDKLDEHNGRYHIWIPVHGDKGRTIAYVETAIDASEIKNTVEDIERKQSLVSFLVFILSGIILIFVVKAIVLTPLNKLKKIVDAYSKDKDAEKLEQKITSMVSEDEIGLLAASFKDMAYSIDEYTSEIYNLATDKERISAELDVATKIQVSMLPVVSHELPDINALDLYASMDPAKEVGGDFYDFFVIDEDHIGLVMADVSGKGIPAALIMMIAKTIIKIRVKSGEPLKEVLFNMNNQIINDNDMGYFVTMWLAKLELSTGKLVSVNAGHEYPLIKRADGSFEIFKDRHSAAIGAFDDTEYFEEEIYLNRGDKLFIYTDGVPEANKGDDTYFGMERLLTSLNSIKEYNCKDIIDGIKSRLQEFTGQSPQFDDITMMCFEYKGSGNNESSNIRKYKADVMEFDKARTFVEDKMKVAGVSQEESSKIIMCLEEMFTNIANYGYKDNNQGYIELNVEIDDIKAQITLTDSGIPFNPLEKEEPDTDLPLELRPVGGLGIFLVRKYMNIVKYNRLGEKNVFTMIKNL